MIRPKRKETRKTVGWHQRSNNRVPWLVYDFSMTPFHRVPPYEMELISQPDVFLVSFLFGQIIVTFFIQNVFVSCII